MRTTLGFSLDTEEHADILKWSKEQENLSHSVRLAIRAYITPDTTLTEIHRMLEEIVSAPRNVVAKSDEVAGNDEVVESEDVARARKALDNLGL